MVVDAVENWENNVCAAIYKAVTPQPSVAQPCAAAAISGGLTTNPMQQQHFSNAASTTIAKAEVMYDIP